MKNTLFAIALASAGLFTLPSISHAADTSGFFINGNVGQSNLDKGIYDDDDTAFGGNFGYRWAVAPNVLIGLEGGYTDLGEFEPKGSSGIGGKAELKGWNLGANGHFNLTDNWYISGRGGFFRADRKGTLDIEPTLVSVDDTKNGWYAGAGFGYDFNTNFSLGLNYDYYKVDKDHLDLSPSVVSVSGEYRF
jgi:opacity protein-like surface antigen